MRKFSADRHGKKTAQVEEKRPVEPRRQTTTKKQPPNARLTAIKIINRILKDGAYSNLVLNETLPQ